MGRRFISGGRREDEMENSVISLTQRIAEIDCDYLESTMDERVIIISKYDEAENWAAFICKRIDGNILCGGHMGLVQPVSVLLEWISEMRIRGIEVVVDGGWFSINSICIDQEK